MITFTKTDRHGSRIQTILPYISKAQSGSVYLLIAYIDNDTIIVEYDPAHENEAITQFRQYIYWQYRDIIIPEILTYKLTGGLTPYSNKKFSEQP